MPVVTAVLRLCFKTLRNTVLSLAATAFKIWFSWHESMATVKGMTNVVEINK